VPPAACPTSMNAL